MNRIAFLTILLFSLFSIQLSARGRVRFGTEEVIKRVADLPNTDDYLADDGSGNQHGIKLHLDLAIKYKRFEISSAPLWLVEEPIFVGINNFNKEDGYYDLTEEEINKIITDNSLNREEMLHLSFFTKHGGFLIILILVIIYIAYLKLSPKEKEDEIEYNNN